MERKRQSRTPEKMTVEGIAFRLSFCRRWRPRAIPRTSKTAAAASAITNRDLEKEKKNSKKEIMMERYNEAQMLRYFLLVPLDAGSGTGTSRCLGPCRRPVSPAAAGAAAGTCRCLGSCRRPVSPAAAGRCRRRCRLKNWGRGPIEPEGMRPRRFPNNTNNNIWKINKYLEFIYLFFVASLFPLMD